MMNITEMYIISLNRLNINKSNVNDLDVRTIIDRVVTLNAEKLTKRLKNNTIHGDGDYR